MCLDLDSSSNMSMSRLDWDSASWEWDSATDTWIRKSETCILVFGISTTGTVHTSLTNNWQGLEVEPAQESHVPFHCILNSGHDTNW